MSDAQTLLHFFEFLFLSVGLGGLGINQLKMVLELFLFAVFVTLFNLVVEFGFDLGDAPVFDLRLEEERAEF